LNIDADHLEYFKTLDNIIKSFNKFSNQTGSRIIVNGDDANSLKAVENVNAQIVTFGIEKECDFTAKNIKINDEGHWEFDIAKNGKGFCSVALKVPGHHNIYNALAAAAAADYAGADPDAIAFGLDAFTGAKRRYDIHTVTNGITIADDYAHHPAELEAILSACKEQHFKRVWAVFQPFTYTRTKDHMDEFAEVLKIADKVVLTEIMAAREIDDLGVNSQQLCSRIPGAMLMPSFEAIADYVVENAQPGDLVLTMGCGDIYKCAKIMTKLLEEKYK
ncbi:MAG: UDP-N-acetylmuramate--L-alanine ligase, partial [Clostridia bacterium]|nr:UDP-N-acetylmuramate--L-alanine ligase [Clostridia bacterium]